MKCAYRIALVLSLFLLLTGCGKAQSILHGVDERDANIIVVMLESKGIPATKASSASSNAPGETGPPKYDIFVDAAQSIEAMSFLNRNGFPRRTGPSLLDIFEKSGLMSSDKEETIRYQSGLAGQLANMIQMIDGVLDVSVQLSFPSQEQTPGAVQSQQPITAAVFIKHQGYLDDPNIQIESKVKRLIASSVSGLDINHVTVVTDRARLSDIVVDVPGQNIGSSGQEYVKIWSMIISRSSLPLFRMLFFFILLFSILFMGLTGWLIWKVYPLIREHGWRVLFGIAPITSHDEANPKGDLHGSSF